jgi:parvulin-like peptidyl-prolyl isomerase
MPAKARVQGRANRLFSLLLGIALLLLGGVIGGLIVHQRDQADPVIATVNGAPITQNAFFHRLQIAAGTPVMRQMVAEEMQLQFAKQMGVLPADAEVDSRYTQASQQPQFQANLKSTHQTPDDVKHSLKVNLAQAAVFNKGISVSDSDIHAFYDHNTDKHNPNARYYRPETVQLAVIITDKPANVNQALHDLARGVPFATAAKAYSKDRSAANGGLLPAIQRGRLDPKKFPGLEKRLFNMQPGEQIDRVKIAGAWWIIRCLNKQSEATVPFDKVKEECRMGAMLAKGLATNGKNMQDEYAAFQKEAEIKALWPQYAEAVSTK